MNQPTGLNGLSEGGVTPPGMPYARALIVWHPDLPLLFVLAQAYSIDTLVGMLARAGIHVDVVLSSARKGAA